MTNAMNLKWTMGNEKLNKANGNSYRILGYGIPADFDLDGGNTCPGASACRGVCYAKQGRYMMPNVRDARRHNLDYFLKYGPNEFFLMAKQDLMRLTKRTYNVVRIHDSGDFFSQEYLDCWKSIASAFPNVIFYAYTKSLHLDIESGRPNNLRIVQSLGGKFDKFVNYSLPHARIFASDAARERVGYVDGNVNDLPAIEGATCIGLVYHGIRKLTDAQKSYFG
jgi:hypothetical protein